MKVEIITFVLQLGVKFVIVTYVELYVHRAYKAQDLMLRTVKTPHLSELIAYYILFTLKYDGNSR